MDNARELIAIALGIAEDAQDSSKELLAIHLRERGESTVRNKRKADFLRENISATRDAQHLFKKFLHETS